MSYKSKVATLRIVAALASIATMLAFGTTVASIGPAFAYDACQKGGATTHNPHCPGSSSPPVLRVKPVEGWK
jgi:hypothetical protein